MAMTFKVGTRGSRLALAQTEIAIKALRKSGVRGTFEVVKISTHGDVDKRPLFTMDEKGIFEKEVNEAVKTGSVDFAVHSIKDIPSDLSEQLTIASIPRRASPNDVLVNDKGKKLKDISSGQLIGTSSLRRAVQLQNIRPDLKIKPIRGNVETRVKKVIAGEFSAIILAEAGLARIGMEDLIAERFSVRSFVPAPGQGAIGIVCRTKDHKMASMLRSVEDPASRTEVTAERALIEEVEGGCRFPLGALAVSSNNKMILTASVFSADGTRHIRVQKKGIVGEPEKLGHLAAQALIKEGAIELAQGWRQAVQDWNKRS
jgi:hydroxymethylbilane synthase